ncbi:MAG: YqgE/AlgH family protein [Sphingomonadaceae bacterium]
MDAPAYLSGQLLLALPGMGDPRFSRAVIAMCAHDGEGALGIGIGRLMPRIRLHNLLEQLDIDPGHAPDVAIHAGGPVEPQRGFVLHGLDWGGQDTLHVGHAWGLTSTLDVLRAIAEGKGPSRWLVALGYAGWAEGQLEEEMTGNAWFATAASESLLFDTPVEQRWSAGFASAGIDVRLLAPEIGHA